MTRCLLHVYAVVFSAADVAVRAIAKQTGAELSLRDVPLETLQVGLPVTLQAK